MNEGVRVVRANERSGDTHQTQGMRREAAIAPETTGSRNLWMGLVTAPAGMPSAWHHHGDCETAFYVLQGRLRFRWGKGGAETVEVGPGDFVSVAPNAIHREESVGAEDGVIVLARACGNVTAVTVEGPEPA